jgi:hypothetical protein
MAHLPDVLLKQAARLLGEPPETLDTVTARDAIRSRPGDVASVLFAEAADNDDVVSIKTARAYLEDRLDFLAPLLDAETAAAIRTAFERRVAAWE